MCHDEAATLFRPSGFPDAVEIAEGADEDLAAADGGRGVAGFLVLAERIGGDQLELRRGFDDVGVAVVVEEVEQVADAHRRRPVMMAEFFLPETLAGPGLQAARGARIGHDEEIRPARDGRGDVGDDLRIELVVPRDVRFGDVARAIRPDADEVMLREPAGDEEDAVGENRAGDKLLGRAVHDPELLAGGGVVAGDALAAAEDHLGLAGGLDDDRRAVGTRAVGAVGAPAFDAGVFLIRHDPSDVVLVAVEDDEVLVKHRRTAEAVLGGERAGRFAPQLLAVHVVAGDDDVGRLQERDPDALAVGGGRAAGVAVELVHLLRRRGQHGLLPERLAAAPVEAEQIALLALGNVGRHENAVAPDDRRGMAHAGDGGFPRDVLGAAPVDGSFHLVGNAVAERPAPGRPFAGHAGCRQKSRRDPEVFQSGEHGRRV